MSSMSPPARSRSSPASPATRARQVFFQVFGIVYALVAVLGFVTGDGMVLGMVANNAADTWLHVVIALFALYVGFVMKPDSAPATS